MKNLEEGKKEPNRAQNLPGEGWRWRETRRRRFEEEIERIAKPFLRILAQSRILEYLDELAEEKEGLEVQVRLTFGFGDLGHGRRDEVEIDRNGVFGWSSTTIGESKLGPPGLNSSQAVQDAIINGYLAAPFVKRGPA